MAATVSSALFTSAVLLPSNTPCSSSGRDSVLRRREAGGCFSLQRKRPATLGSRRGAVQSVRAQQQDSGRNALARQRTAQVFSEIERVLLNNTQGSKSTIPGANWEDVQGSWVLRPTNGRPPEAIIHFAGGAFVGAAPQLTYKLFLELLAQRQLLVVATPFVLGFDHLRIADEVQFKYDRAMRELRLKEPSLIDLPTFGVGHSLGSLIHLLVGARYAVQRSGNVLLSFNNKSAIDAIPGLSPVLAPLAQGLGPFVAQMTSSPIMASLLREAEGLRGSSPPLLKQLLPLLDQLSPLYDELRTGRAEFTPSPEDSQRMIRGYYGVGRNLLVRFRDDGIDETPALASWLQSQAAVSAFLDMRLLTLPGDHGRPLQLVAPDLSESVATAATRGSELLAGLTAGTPFAEAVRNLGSLGAEAAAGLNSSFNSKQAIDDMTVLVDELVAWINDPRTRALPS
eukprot:jgi/Chlat1/7096/Chrsp57S06783